MRKVLLLVLVAFSSVAFGATLRFGINRDIDSMDPFYGTRSVEHGVRSLVFEPLLLEKDYEVAPHLASQWDISKDGREIRITLKKGIRFHNGKELMAEDVKWSMEYVMNPKNRSYGNALFADVQSVEVQSPFVLKVTMKEPLASFLMSLTTIQTLPVVAKDSLKSGERPMAYPPGTGPYTFVHWKPGTEVLLKKFSQYWQRGLPKTEQILFKPIPEPTVRFTALRSGDLDLAERIPFQFVDKVQKGEIADLKAFLANDAGMRGLVFNLKQPPFDNTKVRQAFAYGIDKEEILKGAFWGLGVTVNQKMGRKSPWYFPIPERKRNVEKAKELLREAGYPNGIKTKLFVWRGSEHESEIMQRQLREAGIQLELQITEFANYIRNLATGDFGVGTYGGDFEADPHPNYYAYFKTTPGKRQRRNFSRFSNEPMDKLLDEGKVTLDRKRRLAIYREVVEILDRELPVMWLAIVPYAYIYRNNVKNFGTDSQGLYFSGDQGIPYVMVD